ncbi:MAG: hypothetical protein GF365_05205 [Candidatus Buchananbacteria bacterium]|nr:hypothetical protein [Candidatus Buchananbacteria bacterium]
MTLIQRRIIMIIFILAFFILAPILIFYASGYRFDLKRKKVLRTGTLMVEAKDIKDAQLYINDQRYEKPFDKKIFIYNLLPGEYNIKLTKEGYYSWSKKITINSGLTTFAKDVILFQDNIPLQIIDGQISNFKISPDWQKIIYVIQKQPFSELYVYDLNNKNNTLLYRISQINKIKLSWAASSKKILFNFNDNYLVFDVNNTNQAKDLNQLLDFQPQKINWDISSDNLLYANKQKSIWQIDLVSQTSQLLFETEKNINPEFFIEANDIFYIQREDNRDVLFKYNLNFNTNKKISALNRSDNYKFIESSNNFIGLLDLDLQKLFLIQKVITDRETNISREEPIQEFDAKHAVWDNNEKQLLIYNDFEITTYNTGTGEKTFINRYGQEIKKIDWYPNLNYIIILFETKIEIIDLILGNGVRNSTQLVEFDQLNDFYLDEKGENIYFNGQIGKQQGIYRLEIK